MTNAGSCAEGIQRHAGATRLRRLSSTRSDLLEMAIAWLLAWWLAPVTLAIFWLRYPAENRRSSVGEQARHGRVAVCECDARATPQVARVAIGHFSCGTSCVAI